MMKQEKYSSSKGVFKLVANILSWTALAILILIAIFLLYLTISTKIYAKKGEAYEPKFSLYTIISPSMHPNLRVYDVIVNERVDSPNQIEIGDIITFISTSSISSNKTITHRVIDIIVNEEGKYEYKTKGDNNLSPDLANAEYANILGRVMFKIPQLGRIQFFLANQAGWLVAIVIPALIIIGKDIMKLTKLLKINKKAEGLNTKTKEEEEEEKKKQEAEKERKEKLKNKIFKKREQEEKNKEPSNIELPIIKQEDAEEKFDFLSSFELEKEENQYSEEIVSDDEYDSYAEVINNDEVEETQEISFTENINLENTFEFELPKMKEAPSIPEELEDMMPKKKDE